MLDFFPPNVVHITKESKGRKHYF